MRKFSVLLTASDGLPEKSVLLQQFFVENQLPFVINFQKGSHAQFFVETSHCREHLKRQLEDLGLNVEVDEEVSERRQQREEDCHECSMALTKARKR